MLLVGERPASASTWVMQHCCAAQCMEYWTSDDPSDCYAAKNPDTLRITCQLASRLGRTTGTCNEHDSSIIYST
jgi:hypothetical protein